jgi:hypothetical protein
MDLDGGMATTCERCNRSHCSITGELFSLGWHHSEPSAIL